MPLDDAILLRGRELVDRSDGIREHFEGAGGPGYVGVVRGVRENLEWAREVEGVEIRVKVEEDFERCRAGCWCARRGHFR